MERNNSGSNSFESSADDDDIKESSKSSKKKSLRLPLAAPEEKSQPQSPSSSEEKKPEQAVSLDTLFTEKEKAESQASAEKESVDVEHAESTMTAEETSEAAATIAHEHLAAMQAVDEETAEAIAPASEFLEKVESGEDIDQAFSEVAVELGMDQEQIDEALGVTDAENTAEVDEPGAQEHAAEHVFDPHAESEAEVSVSENTSKTMSATPARSTAPSSNTASSGGGSAGGGYPPTGGSAPGGAQPSGPMGRSANQVTSSVHNTLPTPAAEYYTQRRNAGELLLVGVVGYLLGRRRGRIKTENRLKPVQKRLEKQVKSLEENITFKEQQLVAAKARIQAVEGLKAPQAKPEKLAATRPTNVQAPAERTQPSRVETRLALEKPASAEQLGRMVVAAEAPKKIERPSSIRRAFKAEEVPTMARNELLELSEKILVEGASLRRIYESRLISEKQLRRLVGEYLQGKDISKDLRHEMVEHEIDFERDPILRDRVRSQLTGDGGKSGLGQLLKSVGVVDETADPVMQKRIEDEERMAAERLAKRQRQRAAADTAMVTIIVGLAILVTVLVFRG